LSAWRRLHEVEGPRATVIDLYELVARTRRLAAHELPMAERYALAHSVMPAVWPGFATTEGSDRGVESITIVAYDPDWPMRYDRSRQLIESALGDVAVRVEHVGSTSVPGLVAKPIIDVQISVDDLDAEGDYVPGLEQIGLQLRSRDDWHRYFRPFPDQPRDVHVHVCAAGSDWERDHLLFRDYLRSHPQACEQYADAKRSAARLWSDDGLAFTDAKTAVVLSILPAAETWAAGGRP
jgi:GrpB-like predicted nucleotidyltransferase (UPF0157 family)